MCNNNSRNLLALIIAKRFESPFDLNDLNFLHENLSKNSEFKLSLSSSIRYNLLQLYLSAPLVTTALGLHHAPTLFLSGSNLPVYHIWS